MRARPWERNEVSGQCIEGGSGGGTLARSNESENNIRALMDPPKTKFSVGGHTKTYLNWPQTDEWRKQGFHEKVEFDL